MVIISTTFSKLERYKYTNSIVSIGSFDGVHLAHKKIFDKMNALKKQKNNKNIVITFNPHPKLVLQNKNNKKKYLLTKLEDKINLIGAGYDSNFIKYAHGPTVRINPSNNMWIFLVANTEVSVLNSPSLFIIPIQKYTLLPDVPVQIIMNIIVIVLLARLPQFHLHSSGSLIHVVLISFKYWNLLKH